MADTDKVLQELKSINNRFDGLERGQKRLENDLHDVKQGQRKLEQGQAQTNTTLSQVKTAVEALAAGQDDLREKVANLPTRPEFQDFRASVGRKIQDHESRIEELEKDADIPHPHKH